MRTAASALDEARVHEIAREEADAALARAKPASPKKTKASSVDASADTPDQPIPYAPSAPIVTPTPAPPQDAPAAADRG